MPVFSLNNCFNSIWQENRKFWTARTAVAEAWRSGGVVEWQSGRVAEWQRGRGSLARRVSQVQGDSRFSFPSAFLLIHLYSDSPSALRLHSDHFVCPTHPKKVSGHHKIDIER